MLLSVKNSRVRILASDTLGIITLAAGVVTTLRTSTKYSVRELTDYTTYVQVALMVWIVTIEQQQQQQ